MGKIQELCKKHREILMYLLFGVLTTAVGWIVYFAVLWALKAIMGIAVDDTSSARYIVAYTVAQVVQWVAAVLFAFFTNRKWVFTEADKNVSVWLQLVKFSGGRVITFFIDYVVTLFVAIGVAALIPANERCISRSRVESCRDRCEGACSGDCYYMQLYLLKDICLYQEKNGEIICLDLQISRCRWRTAATQ